MCNYYYAVSYGLKNFDVECIRQEQNPAGTYLGSHACTQLSPPAFGDQEAKDTLVQNSNPNSTSREATALLPTPLPVTVTGTCRPVASKF